MDKELARKLSDQMVFELYSGYLYLAMAVRLEDMKLPGMARWMRRQSQEELGHARGLINYLTAQSMPVRLMDIDAPPPIPSKICEIFTLALSHEKKVTARLQKLADEAMESRDYVSFELLQRYLREQVEEERQVADLIAKLDIALGDASGVLYLDAKMGTRNGEFASDLYQEVS